MGKPQNSNVDREQTKLGRPPRLFLKQSLYHKVNKIIITCEEEKLGKTKEEIAGRDTKFCWECKLVSLILEQKWSENSGKVFIQ